MKAYDDLRETILNFYTEANKPSVENDFTVSLSELVDLVSVEMYRRKKFLVSLGRNYKNDYKKITLITEMYNNLFRDTVKFYMYQRPDSSLSFWMGIISNALAETRVKKLKEKNKMPELVF